MALSRGHTGECGVFLGPAQSLSSLFDRVVIERKQGANNNNYKGRRAVLKRAGLSGADPTPSWEFDGWADKKSVRKSLRTFSISTQASSTAMYRGCAAESTGPTALAVKRSACTGAAAVLGTTCAVKSGHIGGDTRVGKGRLTIAYHISQLSLGEHDARGLQDKSLGTYQP